MSVESGTTISGLQASWPAGQDSLLEGDDHIRLIKAILKAQFPGALGSGFAKAISASEDEINYLSGVTSSVQDQLDALANDTALVAPSGTKLSFFQASPPVGWTAQTGVDDAMLRVVTSNGGGTGGSASPISLTLAHSHTTQAHTLTIDEMPSHNHTYQQTDTGAAAGSGQSYPTNDTTKTTDNTGGGSPHEHGDTGSALSDWAPKYANVIIAVKD